VDSPNSAQPRFRWVRAPTSDQLTQLTPPSPAGGRLLEREGLQRDIAQLGLGEALDTNDPTPELAVELLVDAGGGKDWDSAH